MPSTFWSPITFRRVSVRGYANYDKKDAVLAKAQGRGDQGALLGLGSSRHDHRPDGRQEYLSGDRRAIEREPLVQVAHTYFRQSEQLPTFIRLAVARHYGPGGAQSARGLALARRWLADPEVAAGRRHAQPVER